MLKNGGIQQKQLQQKLLYYLYRKAALLYVRNWKKEAENKRNHQHFCSMHFSQTEINHYLFE